MEPSELHKLMYVCIRVCVCVCVCLYPCACVCMCERERESVLCVCDLVLPEVSLFPLQGISRHLSGPPPRFPNIQSQQQHFKWLDGPQPFRPSDRDHYSIYLTVTASPAARGHST